MDKVHCLRVLCSHPCCWDTESRCTRGIPNCQTAAPVKRCSLIEENLPSLSIVNVSEWAGQRIPLYKSDKEASLNDVTSISCTKQTNEMIKRVDTSFPGSNMSFSSIPTKEANKMVKLNTVYIRPLIGCSELPQCPVVIWNPNPQHVPQWLKQNKSKSPNLAIKELICPPFYKLSKVSSINWQVQRRQVNLEKKYNHLKWKEQRGRNCTLEGAGIPQRAGDRWVGIGFNPIPKITPHHLSRSLLFKDTGCISWGQKLPSLTTPNPNHSNSLSPVLNQSVGSMKCGRSN